MLLTIKYRGHEIGFIIVEPIQCKKAAFHKLAFPTTKAEAS